MELCLHHEFQFFSVKIYGFSVRVCFHEMILNFTWKTTCVLMLNLNLFLASTQTANLVGWLSTSSFSLRG